MTIDRFAPMTREEWLQRHWTDKEKQIYREQERQKALLRDDDEDDNYDEN